MKAKKDLSNNHTIDTKNENRKTWVHFDDYLNVNSGRHQPISEGGLDMMGEELLKWASTDDALVLEDFFLDRGIPEMTYRQWKKRNALFGLRYETAKAKLGSRREKGGLKRSYSERIVLTSMPKFDHSWTELEEWRSGLRTVEQAAGKADVKVVMEKFPSTDVVPEKKNENKKAEESEVK